MQFPKTFAVIICTGLLIPAVVEASLIAHWEFEDNADDSVAGYTGILNGGQYVDGKVGKAVEFDGQNDYIDCGDILNDIQPSFSIAVWLKPEDFDRAWCFSSENSRLGSYAGFWFGFNPTGKIELSYGDGGGANPKSRRSIQYEGSFTDEWVHLVGVVRGAEDMDIYVDGVNVGGSYSGTGGSIAHSYSHASIGRREANERTMYFDGLVDDLRIYDHALTSQEVQNIPEPVTLLLLGFGGFFLKNGRSQ